MENYSERHLTYPTDKLPAMAGIVQHYQAMTKDIPILGMWQSSLHRDLLWMRVRDLPALGGSATSTLNIPSWSWLSCPTDISFHHWYPLDEEPPPVKNGDSSLSFKDELKVIDWSITWKPKTYPPEIDSAWLVIEGPVKKITLAVDSTSIAFNPPKINIGNEKPDFTKGPIPWRCAGQFDAENRMIPTSYLCLLVRSKYSYVYDEDIKKTRVSWQETFMLLELSIENGDAETYRRVGVADIRGENRTFDYTARRILRLV